MPAVLTDSANSATFSSRDTPGHLRSHRDVYISTRLPRSRRPTVCGCIRDDVELPSARWIRHGTWGTRCGSLRSVSRVVASETCCWIGRRKHGTRMVVLRCVFVSGSPVHLNFAVSSSIFRTCSPAGGCAASSRGTTTPCATCIVLGTPYIATAQRLNRIRSESVQNLWPGEVSIVRSAHHHSGIRREFAHAASRTHADGNPDYTRHKRTVSRPSESNCVVRALSHDRTPLRIRCTGTDARRCEHACDSSTDNLVWTVCHKLCIETATCQRDQARVPSGSVLSRIPVRMSYIWKVSLPCVSVERAASERSPLWMALRNAHTCEARISPELVSQLSLQCHCHHRWFFQVSPLSLFDTHPFCFVWSGSFRISWNTIYAKLNIRIT